MSFTNYMTNSIRSKNSSFASIHTATFLQVWGKGQSPFRPLLLDKLSTKLLSVSNVIVMITFHSRSVIFYSMKVNFYRCFPSPLKFNCALIAISIFVVFSVIAVHSFSSMTTFPPNHRSHNAPPSPLTVAAHESCYSTCIPQYTMQHLLN
jgi:hypothetical protein